MDGAGDTGHLRNTNDNRPQLPVLLVEGHDMEDDGSGEGLATLAERMDELCTDDLELQGECSPSSEYFEKVIGAIEEIVVGDEFQSLQNYFLSTYWTKFSESHRKRESLKSSELGAAFGDFSEEKHEHFKIFQTYSQDMAHLLESQLRKAFRDEDFHFNQFVEEFSKRVERGAEGDPHNLLESEIFEMLFTLIDFVKFKELFMDYKEMMEGKTPNLSTGITLKPFNSKTLN